MEQFVTVGKTTSKFWFSKRFFVAVLMFLVTLHLVGITVNLNIAVVAMTSNRTIKVDNETIVEEPEFHWNSKTKNFVLGVFSYGFFLLLFGSPVTLKLGGSKTIGISLVVISLMTIISPFVLRCNFYLYVAMRMLEGIFEGLIYVSFAELWSQWAPIQDRSKLMSIGYWGSYVGSFVAYPICGYSIHKFGWPAAFYVTGASTLICSLLWLYFVPNTPLSDKWISKKELTYIIKNKDENNRPEHVVSTLKHIVTSKCIWALGFCKFTFAFGSTFVTTCLPMYIKDITNVDIDQVGVLAGLPNILCALAFPFCGYILDYVQNKGKLTPTQMHKLFIFSGYTISAALMISIVLFELSFKTTMVLFTIFNVATTFSTLLILVGCICLAPQCASLVDGFMELFYSLGYFGGPMIVGFLVTDHKPEEWNQYISLICIVSLACAITYVIFGSAEAQPWSYTKRENNRDRKISSIS